MRSLLLLLTSLAVFCVAAWFMPRQMLFDYVNSIGVVLGACVLWAYAPGVWEALWRPSYGLSKAHFLILGIFATWIAMIARTSWLWIWRYYGEPEGGLDHVLVAAIAALVAVGGVFHLLAPKVLEGKVPRSGVTQLISALVFGVVLGTAIALTRTAAVR